MNSRPHDNDLCEAHQGCDDRHIEFVLQLVKAGCLTLEQAATMIIPSARELERRLRHLDTAPGVGGDEPVACASEPAIGAQVRISNVSWDSQCLYVRLSAAHEIRLSLDRLPVLAAATETQRRAWSIIGHGRALLWPELMLYVPLTALLRAVHDPWVRCEQCRAS